MSAEIASLEKVKDAVAQIRAQGRAATADRVIAHLGGGSKATVLRHLKALRSADVPEDAVPQGVIDLAKASLAEIYASGMKAGADRSAGGLMRLTTAIDELDAQIDELAAENAILLERIRTANSELDEATRQSAELREALAQSAQELQTARSEVLLERGASAEKMTVLMGRIEATVQAIARNGSGKPRNRDRSG